MLKSMGMSYEKARRKRNIKLVLKVVCTLIFFAFLYFCVSEVDKSQKKYEVIYQGFSTSDFMPTVYKSYSTGRYVSITLYKGNKYFPFIKTRELEVSLEKKENLKRFKKFLDNARYDGLGNWVQ